MLVVMNESTHDEHLSQPLQTNNEQFKTAVTFLIGYNGIFNVSNKNNKFHFLVSFNDDDFCKKTISPRAYEAEGLNTEIKRNVIDEGHFTEASYPLAIQPNFSNLRFFIKTSSNINGSQNVFTPDDIIGDLLGFQSKVTHEEYNLSAYPGDTLSIDYIFVECDIAQAMICRGRRNGIAQN